MDRLDALRYTYVNTSASMRMAMSKTTYFEPSLN